MTTLLDGLNESQLEAVTATEGFIRVIAGAGSGKTRALSRRFAFLVNEMGILPGNILCVTFTNKSANEMRQRIHDLTGDDDTGYINTFHGFCVSILQEDSHAVLYPKSFLVLDNSDIDDILKIIYEDRGLTLRHMTFSAARDMIEYRKLIKNPDYYLSMISMSAQQLLDRYMQSTDAEDIIFYGYLYHEKKCFGLDYNDLIKFSLYIFEECPDICLKWQQRLEYIMIDEFQDIDALQYRLMEVLCGYHHNLFIVGDPDQTIYTWRGADVRYLLDFDKAFPGTRTIMMMQNYRSSPQILAAANSLISANKNRIEKQLIPVLPDGASVICFHADTSAQEAARIAARINELCELGYSRRDIAILYRAHYVTRSLEECFISMKIPYTIYSGTPFFGRMEIKDALCYLRMLVYRDDLSFLRIANVPKRNLGKRRMSFLNDYAELHSCTLYQALTETIDDPIFKGTQAADFISLIESISSSCEGQPVSEVLSTILDRSGYEMMLRTEGAQDRLDNLAELRQSVFVYETTCGEECTLEHYLRHIALFSNTDTDCGEDKIRMMTVHSAKGLEFPCVFLCSVNEGVFPSRKARSRAAMEEERRLAFVALTRAKKELFISEAQGKNFDGSYRYPSRFILDIDPSLLSFEKPLNQGLIDETRQYLKLTAPAFAETADIFPEGQRVHHSVLGDGTVLTVDSDRGAYVIRFDNVSTPRTISWKAKLTSL